MDRLTLELHRLAKGGAGLGRQLFLKTRLEREITGANDQQAHFELSEQHAKGSSYINCSRSDHKQGTFQPTVSPRIVQLFAEAGHPAWCA
jgi:hypothetical protein